MIDYEARTLTEAFYAHAEMEDTRRYLAEGRFYDRLSDDDLRNRWLEAWKELFLFGMRSTRDAYCDLSAELRLRHLAPPEHRMSAEDRERLRARIRVARHSPDVEDGLFADINRFLREWEKPRN